MSRHRARVSRKGVLFCCVIIVRWPAGLLGSIRLPTLFPNGGYGPLLPEPFDHETSRLLVVLVDIVVET